jgi:PAS domain S-box-containing protein
MDMDLKTTYHSPSVAKIRGFTVQEIMEMPLEQNLTPESLKLASTLFIEELPKVESDPGYNPVLTLDLEYYCKDGTTAWAENKFSIIRDPGGKPVSILGESRDITDRRKAEQALKASEAQYRLLSEHMTDTVWLMDMDLKTTYQSPSVQKVRGYTPREIMEMPLEKHLTPGSLKVATEVFLEEMAKLEADPGYNFTRTLDLEFYRKDGTSFWSSNTFTLIRDEKGRPLSILGEGRDITDRRKAEEAVRESERRFKSIVEHITDIFFMLDLNHQLLYISPQVEQALGYTSEEARKNWRDYLTDNPVNLDGHEKTQLAFTTGEKQGPYLQEYLHRDGTKRLAEVNESPLKNDRGEVIGIVGALRDITERNRIEAALRESEGKYRMVVENAQEAICISVEGMFKFANRRTMELSGYSQEELTSRPFIEFIHPDDRQVAAERYNRRLKGMDVAAKFIFRAISKLGDIRWVDLTAVPIIWEGRSSTLSFMTDITDSKRLEEEQQRVEKLESIGLLAGGIAHDFNNILTAILGNISLAKMDVEPGSGIHDSLEQAEKASLRAKELTQQLLTFSKGGAPVKKTASLDQLARDTAGFVLRGSNVRCHFSIPADLWHAEIDAGQVSQVIHNLVLNAQQAMPTGGTIELTAENMVLSETQSLGRGLPLKEGNYVRITVADHGTGIPGDHLEKIFDPFFTTKHKSSGLGLATSFSIARNHGGHLSVESQLGSGSTFYFYLPASAETAAPRQDKAEEIKPAGKARVLVMDDEEAVRKIAGRLLKHIGYADIEFAADGDEAVKLYKTAMESGCPFNVVIMDLTIPGGMGGEAAVRELLKIDPGVRAIVSSGYADKSVMADYKKYGFSGMVAKPYTLEELGKAVHDVIG